MASICETCYNIRSPWEGQDFITFKDTKSSQQLQVAVQNGCQLCRLIQDGISHFIPEWGSLCRDTDKDAVIGFDIKGPSCSLTVEVLVNETNTQTRGSRYEQVSHEFEFYTIQGQPTPYESIGPSPYAIWNPSPDTMIETITRWITVCNEGHSRAPPSHTGSTFPLCQKAEVEALPTRVLDLGPGNTNDDPALIETCGLTARYVCLSHCWGQSRCIKTTRSTHDKWKLGIPWSMLPQTYQDAIVITRRLGIQYIWIDSLCIIQDDSADWERESSRMASVYGNSFLTIAATFAADGNGGCFPTYSVQLHELSLLTPTGEQHTVFVRKHLPHSPYSDRYDERNQNPPLLERAWTFQEHLLAPRVLQCTKSELIWECNSALCCECSYLQPGDAFFKSAYAKATTTSETKPLLPLDENSTTVPGLITLSQISDVRAHWEELVQRYSKRRLTFSSDKLPALSGIAKQLQPLLGPGYFAGLWEQDLLHGLFWEVQSRVSPRRTAEYTAPTWSWASVDGQVFYAGKIDFSKPHAQIIAIHCLPSGQDPTGRVARGASITICAKLVAVQLVYDDHILDPRELEYYVSMYDEEEGEHYPVYRDKNVRADYQLAEHGAFRIPPGQAVFCLRIGTPVDRNRPAHEAWCQALVLRQVAEASYVRIGMVKFSAGRTVRWFDQVPRSFVTIF